MDRSIAVEFEVVSTLASTWGGELCGEGEKGV